MEIFIVGQFYCIAEIVQFLSKVGGKFLFASFWQSKVKAKSFFLFKNIVPSSFSTVLAYKAKQNVIHVFVLHNLESKALLVFLENKLCIFYRIRHFWYYLENKALLVLFREQGTFCIIQRTRHQQYSQRIRHFRHYFEKKALFVLFRE